MPKQLNQNLSFFFPAHHSFQLMHTYGSHKNSVVELCFPLLWDPMGDFRYGGGSVVWIENLVWKTFFGCLEYSPLVFDVDNLARTKES